MIAYLGLGSNLGDRLAHLVAGLCGLDRLGRVEASPVYETEPVGGPGGQDPYLNLVARLDTGLGPHELLRAAQAIEQQEGRVRTVRFGPRTLDVDLLRWGEVVLDDADLVLPHPRMYERAFVLAPLEDLDATAVPDGWRARLGGAAAVEQAVRKVAVLERAEGSSGWRLVAAGPRSSSTPTAIGRAGRRPSPGDAT